MKLITKFALFALGLLLAVTTYQQTSSAITTEPLRYMATLSQGGTNAPTATVTYNTLGGAPTWSRNSAGFYVATLTNGFPLGRTTVKVPTHQDSLDDYAGSLAQSDDHTVFVFSMIPSGQLSDDCWNGRWVEITVYPEP